MLPWLPSPSDAPRPAAPPAPTPRLVGRRPGLDARLPSWSARPLALVALAVAVIVVAAAVAMAVTWRGGHTVSTPFLSYTAPAGWAADPAIAPLDAPALTGTMLGAGYDCDGAAHVRGYAAATLLPVDASAGSEPVDRAERLARWFATASYTVAGGAAPEVTVAPPRAVRVAGPDGPVEATVTEVTARAAASGGCTPSSGTVLALAAPVSGGAALLLVAGDSGGGPAEPAPPDRATLDAALASVRLGPA